MEHVDLLNRVLDLGASIGSFSTSATEWPFAERATRKNNLFLDAAEQGHSAISQALIQESRLVMDVPEKMDLPSYISMMEREKGKPISDFEAKS
ncbi:uncharacterized protein BDV17DRAFT_294285 [Aspergillus undulatus]|uniref:uncharacterized protein n=1 Tax=Aspergillus undulatus TaxID=1810928 RepID=UPI003CCD601D